ncbi:uncharacterized protein LOC124261877 [Haliotis rubra]|uniref:uncharacterized protein LOC124261877 n=1 Tax=Haliotis rubra TaxID=36100 RepID=UPI001EE6212A|nr:uncharacterized protein LOC124261877 [Haliotis rubra]
MLWVMCLLVFPSFHSICQCSLSFPGGRRQEMREMLEQSVITYRSKGWAESTKRTYRQHLQCYLDFCHLLNIEPVPLSSEHSSLYLAYLADFRGLCFASIRSYICIVRTLHKQHNLGDPFALWTPHHVLQGMRRELGEEQHGATPVTPELLLALHSTLSWDNMFHCSVWAGCMIAFYGLLRSANFLCRSLSEAGKGKLLCVGDVSCHPQGAVITLHWTKTIQFRQKKVYVTLPSLEKSVLCPVTALTKLFYFHLQLKSQQKSALLRDEYDRPLLYSVFLDFVNSCLHRAGHASVKLTGHSFRRGGAQWAAHMGLSHANIQELGFLAQ